MHFLDLLILPGLFGCCVEFGLFFGFFKGFLRSDLVQFGRTVLSAFLEISKALNLALLLLLDALGFPNLFLFTLD